MPLPPLFKSGTASLSLGIKTLAEGGGSSSDQGVLDGVRGSELVDVGSLASLTQTLTNAQVCGLRVTRVWVWMLNAQVAAKVCVYVQGVWGEAPRGYRGAIEAPYTLLYDECIFFTHQCVCTVWCIGERGVLHTPLCVFDVYTPRYTPCYRCNYQEAS